MVNSYHSFTKSSSQKKASYSEIAQWVNECWCNISENCIKNGFKATNICKYLIKDLIFDHIESEEECEKESEDQINSEIQESFI